MIDLALTNDDLTFTEGDVVTVSDVEAVAQRVHDRLHTFRTEWFLDQEFGPDYLRDVLKKNPSLTLVQSILTAQAELSLDGEAVLDRLELTLESSTRILKGDLVVRDPETQAEAARQLVIG